MERIFIGTYFSNENVKKKFLDFYLNNLDKLWGINESGKLFVYDEQVTKDSYVFYNYPFIGGEVISENKLQTLLFVIDDEWVDFDEMFEGVKDAKIDNIVLLYTGSSYELKDMQYSCDTGAYIKGVYAKCFAKQILLDDALQGKEDEINKMLNLLHEIKEHIHAYPFVINNLTYTQTGPKSIKCSGLVDSGFIQKGDRISIFSKGGKEVVGKINTFMTLSMNPTLNAKKGQTVRLMVDLEEEYKIEGNLLRAISTDRSKKGTKFNAIITMYDAEFDGYRVLDKNANIEFHMLNRRCDGFICKDGLGYLDGDDQRFKSLSSGNSDMFTLSLVEEQPLVLGTTFIIEKSWNESNPCTYGYATIVELID